MKGFRFNPKTLSYEKISEWKFRGLFRAVVVMLTAVGMLLFYAWMYTSVLRLEWPKTIYLRARSQEWNSRMGLVSRHLDLCEETLRGIEMRDDHVYRSIFGLDTIGGDKRGRIDNLEDRIDDMASRAYARNESLAEMKGYAEHAGDMALHVPSVPPVFYKKGSCRISSTFGGRMDPVYHRYAYHHGLDFAAKKGYPIYVTADGIVEKVDYKFKGYGNEVIVDHGFGYKTRYAHLSVIDVQEGMTLRRGEKIGEIGNSGKSTGPHLHYEVLYRGKATNPMAFMDLDMDPGEYRTMVRNARDNSSQAANNEKPSIMELLRRRRTSR